MGGGGGYLQILGKREQVNVPHPNACLMGSVHSAGCMLGCDSPGASLRTVLLLSQLGWPSIPFQPDHFTVFKAPSPPSVNFNDVGAEPSAKPPPLSR